MKYIIPSKTIEHCIHNDKPIADVYSRYYNSNITFLKLVPKDEDQEIVHCWEAMGFRPLNREVSITAFTSKNSILDQLGLYNDDSFNEVFEKIKGNSRNKVTGRWRGKRDIKCATSQWKARDKKVNQKKFKNFDDLYSLCSHYHLNHNFISKQFNHLDTFCTNSGVLIKKMVGRAI